MNLTRTRLEPNSNRTRTRLEPDPEHVFERNQNPMSYCALCLKEALRKKQKIEYFEKLDSYCTWHYRKAAKLPEKEVKELISKGREKLKEQERPKILLKEKEQELEKQEKQDIKALKRLVAKAITKQYIKPVEPIAVTVEPKIFNPNEKFDFDTVDNEE